jgi:hypothetical protein
MFSLSMSSDFVAPDKLEPTTIPILVESDGVNTCFEEFNKNDVGDASG